jgi:hypothetical protein
MKRSRAIRVMSLLLALDVLAATVPLPVFAALPAPAELPLAAPASPAADTTATVEAAATPLSPLDQARELLRDGEYDRSIDVLKAALATSRSDPARLRETYLLLIKTYVFIGNDLKFKPQGRAASNLNYLEARRLIAECLGTRELRHTRPEPASQYPPEMVTFFAESRRALFGGFRVRELTPAHAVVLLDGDTLRALPGGVEAGDIDLATGPHGVVVRARGYQETTDHITIPAGVNLERSYRLTKKKSGLWYATRGAGALGLLAGAILGIATRGGSPAATKSAPTLPGAPDPPPAP